MSSSRELTPGHDPIECAVCGRTVLKGERPEAFLVRDGGRRLVCELCTRRAEQSGWIRESASPDLPAAQPRFERRPSLLARLRRRGPAPAADAEPPDAEAGEGEDEAALVEAGDVAAAAPDPGHSAMPEWRGDDGPRDPRHVRAVPTNADVKIAHALDLFNASEHARTIAGLCRTLGPPWVSAHPLPDAPSEVSIVVAWELSWYRFQVDLGDVGEPVLLVGKGNEVAELDEPSRRWNAAAFEDGTLSAGAVEAG